MEATASAKYLRGSAQKARLVIDMIRGKDVNRALAILRFTNKRAADGIEKCMRSAIANANEAAEKANVSIDPDDLWVKSAFVDRGPTKNRRRVRPAPQGRAYREQRHFCHVTILLTNDARPEFQAKSKGDSRHTVVTEAKPAKLAESKSRRRGGAAAAPRAKRTASKAERVVQPDATADTGSEKKASKRTRKPRAGKDSDN
ncbi:MAG TPA: 50S ribosomal protein L22 [Pyrinomonadaceae bacterium]|nr:50S ribosomal protein L22 [Pyrinomonadaceae bacterium]